MYTSFFKIQTSSDPENLTFVFNRSDQTIPERVFELCRHGRVHGRVIGRKMLNLPGRELGHAGQRGQVLVLRTHREQVDCNL